MYEVATVAGNKLDAAYAIKSLSSIMGQISSTASTNNNHHGGATVGRNGKKIYHRHSSVQPALANIKLLKKENSFSGKEHQIKDTLHKARTEGKNIDQLLHVASNGQSPAAPPVSIATTASNDLNLSKGSSTMFSSTNSKEFFKSGDAYHKTDICYYKTLDNGYHKLPSDSYHKMTEGCYVKLPDGSFRKLDDKVHSLDANAVIGTGDKRSGATLGTGSNVDQTTTGRHDDSGVQYRVKNPVMKFLKRSKSHTPATIAQLQKEKEKNRLSTIQSPDMDAGRPPVSHQQQQQVLHHHHHHHHTQQQDSTSVNSSTNSKSQHSSNHHHHSSSSQQPQPNQNRRVMVTMIDGGLPVVAKSKPIHDKPKSAKARAQEANRDKVIMMILTD